MMTTSTVTPEKALSIGSVLDAGPKPECDLEGEQPE